MTAPNESGPVLPSAPVDVSGATLDTFQIDRHAVAMPVPAARREQAAKQPALTEPSGPSRFPPRPAAPSLAVKHGLRDTGSAPFAMDGRKTCRLIGALVIALGLLTLGLGGTFTTIGQLGKARYERSTGFLARMFSNDDQRLYGYLRYSIAMGGVVKVLGFIITASGVVVVFRPGVLRPVLGRYGFEALDKARQGGEA